MVPTRYKGCALLSTAFVTFIAGIIAATEKGYFLYRDVRGEFAERTKKRTVNL